MAYYSTLLGGPWEIVTTYNWAYNPTHNPPKWAYGGGYPNNFFGSPGTHIVGPWVIDSINSYGDLRTGTQYIGN